MKHYQVQVLSSIGGYISINATSEESAVQQIQKEVEEYKKSTKKKSKKSEGNTTREKTIFKMKKSDQVNLLLELGYPNRDIKTLKYEKDRVAKIIELQNKSKNR